MRESVNLFVRPWCWTAARSKKQRVTRSGVSPFVAQLPVWRNHCLQGSYWVNSWMENPYCEILGKVLYWTALIYMCSIFISTLLHVLMPIFLKINQREHSSKANVLLIAYLRNLSFNISEGTWGKGDGCSWPRLFFQACHCKQNSRSRSSFRTLNLPKFPLKIDNPFLSFLWGLLPDKINEIMFEILVSTYTSHSTS